MNSKCPFCGCKDMILDVDIRVSAVVLPDGKVKAKDFWDYNEINNAINESSCEDMQGFCPNCGGYCDFSWKEGFTA